MMEPAPEMVERAAIRLFEMKFGRRGKWPEAAKDVQAAHRRRVVTVFRVLLEPNEAMKIAADDAANLPIDALPADIFVVMMREALGLPQLKRKPVEKQEAAE